MNTDLELLMAHTNQRREELRRSMERCSAGLRQPDAGKPRRRDRGVVVPLRQVRRES